MIQAPTPNPLPSSFSPEKIRPYFEKNLDQAAKIWPKWTEFIPHEPQPKQLAFLMLPHLEAFYGGAAGGGKSDALLMAALQYVNIPDYVALLFRRSFADLSLPGALIDRSHQWLDPWEAEGRVKWINQQHQWFFPETRAILQFCYIGDAFAETRYQGIEAQFVGFDELSQHEEFNYLYLFSRLRKLACSIHKLDEEGSPIYMDDCQECCIRRAVPLRMRSTSNPPKAGDPGSTGWVKKRFKIKKIGDRYLGTHPKRPFIPAFLHDNQYIDQKGYAASLKNLDPVTREQLLRGDWGVSADGRFRLAWRRLYSFSGEYFILGPDRHGKPHHKSTCRCFITADPAGSTRDPPSGKTFRVHGAASWTVISTWILTPDFNLLWWNMIRFQKEIPDIFPAFQEAYRRDQPEFLAIECNGFNQPIYQLAERLGLPVYPLNPRSNDKIVRATDAMVRMEQGKIWLPEWTPPWMEDAESELFTWSGHPYEPDDIIDTLAYASLYVSALAASSENMVGNDCLPGVV